MRFLYTYRKGKIFLSEELCVFCTLSLFKMNVFSQKVRFLYTYTFHSHFCHS